MVQGFYKTANLNACLKRLLNQYHLIAPVDYNDDADSNASKQSFNSVWPKSMGDGFSTKLEQDDETLEYHFNILLTEEQVAGMPSSDNPNFSFTADNEGTEEEPFVLPTFKQKQYDAEGVWLGTYYDRTVCVMR